MIIPVKDSKGTLRMLNASREVIYVQTSHEGALLFHTEHEVYQPIQKVSEWSELLKKGGFLRVDRGTIVNINQTWVYDDKLRVLTLGLNTGDVRILISEKAIHAVSRLVMGDS